MRDHAFFVSPATLSTPAGQDPIFLQSKVQELENEVMRLREQLGAAKGVNDVMWETVVQRVIKKASDEKTIIPLTDSDAVSRKRTRQS